VRATWRRRAGIKDIITVDIGGTSADICLIKDGRIALTHRAMSANGRCPCRWSTW